MRRKTVYTSLTVAAIFVLVWFFLVSRLLDLPIGRDEAGWTSITHEQYGFSVDYPTKWVAQTYGNLGYRGGEEIKLIIHRSALGTFNIKIRYQLAQNPTLGDVVAWSDKRIVQIHQNLTNQDEFGYKEIALQEDTLNGHLIIRRTYTLGEILEEEVYIARTNDMIIISLQSEKTEFDGYLEDFNRIVNSFTPLQ